MTERSHTPETETAADRAGAIREIERLALQGAQIHYRSETPDGAELHDLAAFVPAGYEVKFAPRRVLEVPKVAPVLYEPESFLRYLRERRTADTILYVDHQKARFTAIIDYHEIPGAQGDSHLRHHLHDLVRPCQHRVALQLQESPELLEWRACFGQWHSQEDLAEWLEDHAHQVADPAPGDILAIARDLHIAQDVAYSGVKRTTDGGYDLAYKENSTGHAGELTVPQSIAVRIPLHAGDEPSTIDCLLRYRLREGQVRFLVRPIRLEETLRQTVQDVRRQIESDETLALHCHAAAAIGA